MMTTPDIASPTNDRIKAVVRLRDRGERDRTGLTVVDGIREIGRALDAGIEVVQAFVCQALLQTEEARALAGRLGSATVTTSERVQRKVAFGDRDEGIVAVVRQPAHTLAALPLPTEPLVVVLEGVEKPGNLGAVLRTADAVGANGLIAADPRTDLFNPNTVRASVGTVFTVPIAAATSEAAIAYLRTAGIRIIAARTDATAEYTSVDLTGPLAIALGSEADGLTGAWSSQSVTAVRLPMRGFADSLNVSITAAVLLYEARRQRGA
jgi:TrmH family RNA methyltransferase